MNTRKLGTIEVSPIGMGCMGFGHGYGEIPARDYSIQAIRAVYFEGAGLMDILPLVWPVALVGLGSMSLATYLFRHKIS